MKTAGIIIIGLAALMAIVFGALVLLGVVDDNPVETVTMISAATLALVGIAAKLGLQVVTWPTVARRMSIREIFTDGLSEGYPLCCITEYLLDHIRGEHKIYWWRSTQVPGLWDYPVLYVPCVRHAKALVTASRGLERRGGITRYSHESVQFVAVKTSTGQANRPCDGFHSLLTIRGVTINVAAPDD